jgi:hypothetical protein
MWGEVTVEPVPVAVPVSERPAVIAAEPAAVMETATTAAAGTMSETAAAVSAGREGRASEEREREHGGTRKCHQAGVRHHRPNRPFVVGTRRVSRRDGVPLDDASAVRVRVAHAARSPRRAAARAASCVCGVCKRRRRVCNIAAARAASGRPTRLTKHQASQRVPRLQQRRAGLEAWCLLRRHCGGIDMPERETLERASKDKREGKAASTQAGEFVREEIHHVRQGKHGVRSTKQAIAIGLSKARRAGVKLKPPERGATSEKTRRSAERAYQAGQRGGRAKSRARSRATRRALEREGRSAASERALARQAKSSARRRGANARSTAAKKASRTKGTARRSSAARKAAKTRARHRRAG